MFEYLINFLPILVVLFEGSSGQSTDSVGVQLPDGSPLFGSYVQAGTGKWVSQFRGIPFAEPPIGNLRFRKPVPKTPWKDALNATAFGPACIQTPAFLEYGDFYGGTMWNAGVDVMSEDCLSLNVYVPGSQIYRPKKLPVMFWIYGGGYISGAASMDLYDGKILASEENVIVVTANYRLGLLGFLYLGREEAPGNMGLWDQQLALQWIHSNIAAFGGDPEQITIFGEAAGAGCVTLQMLSPHSQPLITKVIAQSGSALSPWAIGDPKTALKKANLLYDQFKCGGDASTKIEDADPNFEQLLHCLLQVPAEKLGGIIAEIGADFASLIRLPVLDGHFFMESIDEAMKREEFKRIKLLMGGNHEDGTFIFLAVNPDIFPINDQRTKKDFVKDKQTWLKIAQRMITSEIRNCPAANQAVIDLYEPKGDSISFEQWMDSLDKLAGDIWFTCPVIDFGLAHSKLGGDTYMYLYSHLTKLWPEWMGVLLGLELPYTFGEPLDQRQVNVNYTEGERELSSRMMRYWANFARTGDPNNSPDGTVMTPKWPKYDSEEQMPYMNLALMSDTVKREGDGDKTNLQIRTGGPREEYCKFWHETIPQLLGTAGAKEEL